MSAARRRTILLLTVIGLCQPLLGSATFAQEGSPPGVAVAEFHDQLTNGLKCRRPEEFRFVELVVGRVQEGKLSVDMVKSIFHWARRKNAKTPFPYFERAMRIIAQRLDVEIGP